MPKKQKLELTWIGKDQRSKLEPRILIEDPDKSYHASERVSENDIFDNMLIHGDNLLALKALEQKYAGKVKCVFIDPPYNTGSAFEHYDDGIEHSLWLSLIRERLQIIKSLMAKDGSLWITIDDNEAHYLKVLCDEVFERRNYRTTITWQKKYSVSNNFKGIASITDFILVYSKSEYFKNNLLPRSAESKSRYSNPDNDKRGPWKAVDYLNQASPEKRPNLCYEITNPNTGKVIKNTRKAWKYSREVHSEHVADKRIWWGIDGQNTTPALKLFLSEVRDGMTPHNWWMHEDVGHTDEAKKEINRIFDNNSTFDTPKPERLIKRILELSTNEGDLVLDSFLGSGTTAAVAQKMRRRWIGVELGEHCETHCLPRLKKVVDNTDPGGITESANWKGGGGFRYYELGPSLIEEDKWGNPIISKEFDPPKLTQAMCKLEGFDYAPDSDTYWIQGHSSETDFIYVTSQTMSKAALSKLSDEVGDNRSLLVCCPSFRAKEGDFPNLTLKKIPKAVLKKCEWGRDDYSLQIQELPSAPAVDVEAEAPKKPRRKFGKANDKKQQELF